MKMIKYIFAFFLVIDVFPAGAQRGSEYIVYLNGDTLYTKVYQVKNNKAKVKLKNRGVWIGANQVRTVFHEAYEYESFFIERKKKFNFLIKTYTGELLVYCEFEKTVTRAPGTPGTYMSFGSGGGGMWTGGSAGASSVNVKLTKPYFRHQSEDRKILHPVSIAELKNKTYFYCDQLMRDLVSKVGEFDLSKRLRDETFRDIVRKYNVNCEAQKREESYAR